MEILPITPKDTPRRNLVGHGLFRGVEREDGRFPEKGFGDKRKARGDNSSSIVGHKRNVPSETGYRVAISGSEVSKYCPPFASSCRSKDDTSLILYMIRCHERVDEEISSARQLTVSTSREGCGICRWKDQKKEEKWPAGLIGENDDVIILFLLPV